jgi:hypothetical protein
MFPILFEAMPLAQFIFKVTEVVGYVYTSTPKKHKISQVNILEIIRKYLGT